MNKLFKVDAARDGQVLERPIKTQSEKASMGSSRKVLRGALLLLRCASIIALTSAAGITTLVGLALAGNLQPNVLLAGITSVVLLPLTCVCWVLGIAVLFFIPGRTSRILSGLSVASALFLVSMFYHESYWFSFLSRSDWSSLVLTSIFFCCVFGLAALAETCRRLNKPDLAAESNISILYAMVSFGMVINLNFAEYENPEALGLIAVLIALVGTFRFALLIVTTRSLCPLFERTCL